MLRGRERRMRRSRWGSVPPAPPDRSIRYALSVGIRAYCGERDYSSALRPLLQIVRSFKHIRAISTSQRQINRDERDRERERERERERGIQMLESRLLELTSSLHLLLLFLMLHFFTISDLLPRPSRKKKKFSDAIARALTKDRYRTTFLHKKYTTSIFF